ncbi:cucurbitadienol 11-hydroxylase-like [Humulus lupulus]|uniref:cucurbitadienol 11-hydroxylase-like n=1 Tax=Humulus lupulus TaxID=3486 RepID=UPI002B407242|nr:cucurbitadienol 11-hydroxylase-like [Humulus lupulus]
MSNGLPGLLRKSLKDIPVKGFIIPAGWTVMLVTATSHLNSDIFNDPFEFNPWRWKDINADVVSYNFMPFGRGVRQCPGADYTKAVMATFLHVLLTKYRYKCCFKFF